MQQQSLPEMREEIGASQKAYVKRQLKSEFDNELAEKGEAKDFLTGHKVKRYRRSIHKSMALWLVALYKENELRKDPWVHINELPRERGGDYGKLKLWGLITSPAKGVRPDGSRRTGFFRLTGKGVQFVEGQIGLPKYAFVLNGRLHGFGGEYVKIHQILAGFNYRGLFAACLLVFMALTGAVSAEDGDTLTGILAEAGPPAATRAADFMAEHMERTGPPKIQPVQRIEVSGFFHSLGSGSNFFNDLGVDKCNTTPLSFGMRDGYENGFNSRQGIRFGFGGVASTRVESPAFAKNFSFGYIGPKPEDD